MHKGKITKHERKYLSILVIPHFSDKLRTFSIKSPYRVFFMVIALVLSLLASCVILLVSTYNENNRLKENLSELYSANAEQRRLLTAKYNELDELRQRNESYSKSVEQKINELTIRFNELTDKYISEARPSRSGDRNEKTFSEELMALKNVMDAINELNSRYGNMQFDLSESERKLDEFLETIPTLWPASGRISDNFGYRKDPFTKRNKLHEGLDIAGSTGTVIRAAASGTVQMAKYYGGYGRTVIIDHGRGLSTLYGHASKLLVKEGDKVKKGDAIAKIGSSGRSTGPHLHFEVRIYGTPVDPLEYLESN